MSERDFTDIGKEDETGVIFSYVLDETGAPVATEYIYVVEPEEEYLDERTAGND